MKYEEEYVAWLYENKKIYNGGMLINYLEDMITYQHFLDELGLVDE